MCDPQYEEDSQSLLLIIIFIYGFINILIRGTELMLSIISTCFMLAPFFSGNSIAFHAFLNEESSRVLWKGPYPENFSDIIGATQDHFPLQSSARFHINLQVWTGYILWKTIIFVYASFLIFAARKRSYSLSLAWFSFSIPVLLKCIFQFCVDLLLTDFFHRPIQSQLLQGLDVCFQLIGIVLVSFYVRSLYFREETIREIDRYNEYKMNEGTFPEFSGGITITRFTNENGNGVNGPNSNDDERY